MPAFSVDHITPLTYKAMRMSPDYVADIFATVQAAKEKKVWQGKPEPVDCEDGSVGWRMIVLFPDDRTPLTVHPGYWMVVDSELGIEALPPCQAALRFRAPCEMEWSTAPPALTINEDGSLHVKVRQPKSLNGPWTYVLTRTDLDTQEVVDLEPRETPVATPVQDSAFRCIGVDVDFDVLAGMTTGHNYTFRVTCTSFYGAEQQSDPSDPITLGEPA